MGRLSHMVQVATSEKYHHHWWDLHEDTTCMRRGVGSQLTAESTAPPGWQEIRSVLF